MYSKYIYADTMGSNHKMQRILQNFGFELLGTDSGCYSMGQRKEDRLNYLLTNPMK
jgi:RimJ/RimL family protein N-acetyltransferase